MRKINFGANGVLRAAFALCASMLLTRQACAASGSIGIDSDGWDKPWTTSVTVNRGQEHTFWVTGLTEETSVSGIYVEGTYTYKEDDETWEDWIQPGEWTETYNANGNVDGYYVLLTADDWDYAHESVKSVKFTVTVDGSYDEENTQNNKFTFDHAAGRDNYPADIEDEPEVRIPQGAQSNPRVLTVTSTSTPTNIATCGVLTANVLPDYDSKYHIKATLETGRRIRKRQSFGDPWRQYVPDFRFGQDIHELLDNVQ